MIKASYETSANYCSTTEKSIDIPVQVPFNPQFNFFSPTFHPLVPSSGAIVVNQPIYVNMDVQSTAPFSLDIKAPTLLLVAE
jgi:hypothetical protein